MNEPTNAQQNKQEMINNYIRVLAQQEILKNKLTCIESEQEFNNIKDRYHNAKRELRNITKGATMPSKITIILFLVSVSSLVYGLIVDKPEFLIFGAVLFVIDSVINKEF